MPHTPGSSSRAIRIDRAWGTTAQRGIGMLVAAVALALCVAGGAITSAALSGRPTTVDEALYRAIAGFRAPWLEAPSLALNQLGGGSIALFVVPAIAAVALLVTRGVLAALVVLPLRPITQWAVESLKAIFERPRPPHREIAVSLSAYPSGHSAVAASLIVVLALLVRHRWFTVFGVVYVVAMGYSRLYLNVHWFTDTLGGTALGVAIGLVVWAVVGSIRSLLGRRRA
ncbi:phosphatase PAP2 family protein [Glaciihabitans sp. INWT7]|uniref:phosphatase PAP2 family protein n=1 Tax=Glaciihabitans sp. INWT7 TaxID=2596912 RepID=UPI001627CFD9|nr:phosphatase PAP2 family protein [Glaciihabitans sp. INWT7]